MSVSLQKGAKVSLAKVSRDIGIGKLDTAVVGLGWDVNRRGGVDYDLDAWAMAINSKGLQRKNTVYFGNTSDSSRMITYGGDNLTGAGEGDDETITIKLNELPEDYWRILVGVTIFHGKSRKQVFSDVDNTFIRVFDKQSGKELCRYDDQFKGEFGNCTTVLFGMFEKTPEGWEFMAIGEPGKHGTILEGLNAYKKYELSDTLNTMNGGKRVMAVSLSKGGKVSLAKVAQDAGIASLSKIIVGLGWDCNRYSGGADFDLDAAAFMQGANGKVRTESDFIFYNNKVAAGIEHTGDNRTGEGEGDDEQIKVDLTALDPGVERISFTVTIDQAETRGQNFGMVENSYIHIIDEQTGTELIRYDLGEDFSTETAIVAAELYKHNGEWKFNAIGSGFSGGLKALCANFGIDAE